MQRSAFLGLPVDCISKADTIQLIDARINDGRFTQYGAINAATAVGYQSNPLLAQAIRTADVINVDGMGAMWGAKMLRVPVPERIAGPDLFMNLLDLAARRQYRVFLLGGTEAVVKATAETLAAKMPSLHIAGYSDGYFWDDEAAVVKKIRESKAQLLFVAISSPLQEIFIDRWRDELGVNFVMGVGGTFDIVAGKTKRAPQWMQNSGLEWLYRLIQEPKRMWRRNFVESPLFVLMVLAELWRQRIQLKRLQNSKPQ